MPALRRHRRDHRARAPKRIKRRNLVKFIPRADSDFAFVAHSVFLGYLKRDPAAHGVTIDDVETISKAVSEFRAALAKASVRRVRNPQLVMQKDVARAKAEAVVRRYANIIRANPKVSAMNKGLLRLKPRPKKLGKRKCPSHPPRLRFMGSGDGVAGGIAPGSGSGVHVLRFSDAEDGGVIVSTWSYGKVRKAKPDGAVRLELYFDMIPQGEPVPVVPHERGWPKYLRSYTKSPMEVEHPIPSQPMLIVYWARWADSAGVTSRWSKTCVARVEGWSSHSLPALPAGSGAIEAQRVSTRTETKIVFVAPCQLPPPHHRDELAEDLAALAAGGHQRLLEAA